MYLSSSLSLHLSFLLSFCSPGYVSPSLWSNTSKVKILKDRSLKAFSKCICHCLFDVFLLEVMFSQMSQRSLLIQWVNDRVTYRAVFRLCLDSGHLKTKYFTNSKSQNMFIIYSFHLFKRSINKKIHILHFSKLESFMRGSVPGVTSFHKESTRRGDAHPLKNWSKAHILGIVQLREQCSRCCCLLNQIHPGVT